MTIDAIAAINTIGQALRRAGRRMIESLIDSKMVRGIESKSLTDFYRQGKQVNDFIIPGSVAPRVRKESSSCCMKNTIGFRATFWILVVASFAQGGGGEFHSGSNRGFGGGYIPLVVPTRIQ